MGDGVTSDNELQITISNPDGDSPHAAGTTKGQLIFDDVEWRKERDNDPKHGVGNDEPQGMQYGNRTYSVSATSHFNGAAADLAASISSDEVLEGTLLLPNLKVNVGKLDWNDVRVEASDGGDVTMSVDFDAREYEEIRRSN